MTLSICPSCGGEVRLCIADGYADGTCPNCGRFCGGSIATGEEKEPVLVQKGWVVYCYEAGDDEHVSHEWSEHFETEEEAREYAAKMKREHVDTVDVVPRMVEVEG